MATPVVKQPPGFRHPRGAKMADLAVRTVVGVAPWTENPFFDLMPANTNFLKSLNFLDSLQTILDEDLTL